MTALERKEMLLNILIARKYESLDNLAFELEVSKSTIKRDVLELSLSYPVYTQQGKGGGVFIEKDYYLFKQYLKSEEQECLEHFLEIANPEQQRILTNILNKYKRNR